jgi:hypothetical protein
MAWFKNVVTGMTWLVTDEADAQRCQASPDYEEVDAPAQMKKRTARKRNDEQSDNGGFDRPDKTAD